MSDPTFGERGGQRTLCTRLARLAVDGEPDEAGLWALLDEAMVRMSMCMELGHHAKAARVGESLVRVLEGAEDHERVWRRAKTRQWLGACYAHAGRYDHALAVYRQAKCDYRLLATIPPRDAGNPS